MRGVGILCGNRFKHSGQPPADLGQRRARYCFGHACGITKKQQPDNFLALTVDAEQVVNGLQADDLAAAPLHAQAIGPRDQLDVLHGAGDCPVVFAALRIVAREPLTSPGLNTLNSPTTGPTSAGLSGGTTESAPPELDPNRGTKIR